MYYIIKQRCVFRFHLRHCSCIREHKFKPICIGKCYTTVLDLSEINEPRKKQLKVEILHNLNRILIGSKTFRPKFVPFSKILFL